MMDFYLALWGVCLALILYALVRRRWLLLEVVVPLFLMLSFNVLIGIATPNPDMVKMIVVATFGD